MELLLGDPTKAKKQLGWEPEVSFDVSPPTPHTSHARIRSGKPAAGTRVVGDHGESADGLCWWVVVCCRTW